MSSTPPVPRLKRMVGMILDENPRFRGVQARNSDVALTILIWQRWYSVGTNDDSVVHLYRLFDLPREDNVKRVRAKFQNEEHKYLPTDLNVLKARKIEEAYWEDALGYKLTPEERARHAQTVKEITPNYEWSRAPEERLPAPTTHITKMQAVYLPKSYGGELKQNQTYDVVIERPEIGKPIKMLEPVAAEYANLQAFARVWRVVG